MKRQWLDWAKQIQAISQAGLEYSKDPYDIERFEQLRHLSVEILSFYTEVDTAKVQQLFANETGYATPKVDVRGVVFNQERKILLVRERSDQGWTLPGGWADIGLTPQENVVKEIEEEAGVQAKVLRLIGVADKNRYPHPPSAYHVYKMFILCEITGGSFQANLETSQAGYFGEDELPQLSQARITHEQLRACFRYYDDPMLETFCD